MQLVGNQIGFRAYLSARPGDAHHHVVGALVVLHAVGVANGSAALPAPGDVAVVATTTICQSSGSSTRILCLDHAVTGVQVEPQAVAPGLRRAAAAGEEQDEQRQAAAARFDRNGVTAPVGDSMRLSAHSVALRPQRGLRAVGHVEHAARSASGAT